MEFAIDFAALKPLQAQLAAAPEVVRQELAAAMAEADQLILREVKERTPHASGLLRGSEIAVEKVQGFAVQGFVGSPLNYAQPVELGTRPHFPPVEALMDWVKLRFHVTSDSQARGIAFLIARKISRQGTKGASMFEQAWGAVAPQVSAIFARAADRIAARIQGAA
jgi:hypothetical protein